MVEPWLYRARVDNVVDGDTLDLYLDQGFSTFRKQRIRLKNVDCPEMNTPEGRAAREFTLAWVAATPVAPTLSWPFVIRTFVSARKDTETTDKYSRYEAQVYRWNPNIPLVSELPSLTSDLLSSGHARPWSP